MKKTKVIARHRRSNITTLSDCKVNNIMTGFIQQARQREMETLRLTNPRKWQALQVIECINRRNQHTRT